MNQYPLLKRHMKTFYYADQIKTFNRTNGKYEVTESWVAFQGVLHHLNDSDLNFTESGTYSTEDRKLRTDQLFKNNTRISENQDGSQPVYSVFGRKQYEEVNTKFKSYIAKRAGDTD